MVTVDEVKILLAEQAMQIFALTRDLNKANAQIAELQAENEKLKSPHEGPAP